MPNTLIPYPNVPAYPGVPQLVRPVQEAIASEPVLAIGLGTAQTALASAFRQGPQWGIFDGSGNQLGGSKTSTLKLVENSLLSQITGNTAPLQSTVSLDYMKEMRTASFVTEAGGFASYNKVEMAATPTVTLAFSGNEQDRRTFLAAVDAACKSTNWYSIVTPEVTYVDYTIDRYSYSRRAYRGATLLIVALTLTEIRQVAASFTTTTSPIVNPQNAGATPQVNSGMTQPTKVDQSTLLSIYNKIVALAGAQ